MDLKTTLIDKGIPQADVSKIAGYINSAKREEESKAPDKRPISRNTPEQLVTLVLKYWNLGLPVDGINVVITGQNMGMVTYHGYKNKVLALYPETEFDIQLVREGDEFKVAKESGSVIYTHNIGDPFGSQEQPIIGAYVVFKNKRGEYIETLNKTDYEKMKKASKQSFLWGQWESEFWLKSVIKRACKRHFYDAVQDIDRNDNDDFGALVDEPPKPKEDENKKVEAAVQSINSASNLEELRKIFIATGLMQNKKVVEAKDAKKAELSKGGEQ